MMARNCLYGKPILAFIAIACISVFNACAQNSRSESSSSIDEKVKAFLNGNAYRWRDMNVPTSDGQLLYDIIVENNYKQAVEIGTSTGHSGIWIAWALSKTGGKLITIEIDERRHREALANFEAAGVADYVDARLADAHTLVPQLEGPIDFVFSDADKDWYTNYFKALDPKLVVGGCYTTHNVSQRSNFAYYNFLQSLPNYETTLNGRGSGMTVSYKKAER